ncbi:hypothetical protein FN846DRAFT_893758 [Sphaerosporella brunnea]|uniref:Uncharacterized protein n=1 Tax=Sphaerosporella brunnea TaxID=1250544 RepID=A0A5J5EKX4_9PEZI|nr:hypothetical protein FN846DRAFT_893758 [Sphaerosporella brunnea]
MTPFAESRPNGFNLFEHHQALLAMQHATLASMAREGYEQGLNLMAQPEAHPVIKINQAATYVDQQTNAVQQVVHAQQQQQDSHQDAAVPKKKGRKLARHEDHKSSCKALCIDPKDRVTMGELRAYVKNV